MRENNRKPIEKCRKKLPQFTTMNVIDGQAGLMIYSSLIFYSLTIDNILNIIVLLILAGVSISMLTGENGILTKATESKEQTEIGQEKEEITLAYSAAKTNKGDKVAEDITADELNAELDKLNSTGTASGTGTLTVTFDNGHKYTIDQGTGAITGPTEGTPPTTGKIDGSFDVEKGVNTPKIDEAKGMELVKYDEGTQEWVKDETNSTYSYEEQTGTTENGGTSKWANAKVTINGVESYFVWIPRYAYKIDSATQTIDIKFIKDTGKTATDGTECKYADDETLDTSTDYIIHPAFTTNAELGGGWSTELPGLWVGKYESARSDSEGETQGTSTTIKVQPGVTSWRSEKIGDMYNYAKAYSTELKSHMLKNSEWGAVAYLTHSKYGRNKTEVTINNNSNYLTGNAGNSISASQSTEINAYNAPKGVLASSTGNAYGIYDLSGGACEYVASYYSESTSSNLTDNGSQLVNETKREYVTAYDGTDVNTDYKQGDATYETKGWNGDYTYFVFSDVPFFRRGGYFFSESSAGVFSFDSSSGGSFDGGSFRVCLAVQ